MKRPKFKLNLILFFSLLFLLPLITILLPKKEFSENENRYLEKFPAPTPTALLDKSFMKNFETFFSDHFFLREGWIQLKNGMELASNKKEINGVYLTPDRLIEHQKITDEQLMQKNVQAINTFAKKYQKPSFFMIVPTAEAIYSDSLPMNAPFLDQKSIINGLYQAADPSAVKCIDVFTPLLSAKSQYIYYNTDHHWTSLGAYNGYYASAVPMGLTANSPDAFDVEHASHTFQGTLYSKTLYNGYPEDIIDLYHLSAKEPPTEVTVRSGNKETKHSSIFFREYLKQKDKYCTFLGQNEPCVTIENQSAAPNEKSLLIVKDSYAHSTIQFYMHHYRKITMVDVRYINQLNQYINVADYDQMLFLYNFASITGDNSIQKLARF